MLATGLAIVVPFGTAIAVYVLVLRPVLRQRSWLRPFYDRADTVWGRIGLYLKGWKTVVVGRLSYIAGWATVAHEAIVVFLQESAPGLDWTPLTTLVLDRLGVPAEIRPTMVMLAGAVLVAALGHTMVALRKVTDGPVGHKGIGEPGA
ncbi:hypothetical protein [Rhodoplanes sp. SY1]|uniref:hypothetical protein n=1 Tax=Rhodoplanes sp. SY1 TaxID=3166646 RepID=UPI0038B46983